MKRLLILFVSVLALALSAPAAALAGTATDVVQSKQSALFNLVKQTASASNEKKIGAIFDEMLDYSALAEASLGSEWAARNDAERAEFSDILKQLVQKAYEKNLRKTIDFQIDYLGETPKAGAVTVLTKATSKVNAREEPIEISYKMVEKDGTWRINDIITEGVSLVSSYRNQFTKVIRKDGFPALIKKMKDKLAKGDVSG